MALRVAFQMDHIANVNIAGDSTFALMLEAQARGHTLFHYTPDKLFMRDGVVFTHAEAVNVQDIADNHYTLEQTEIRTLTDFDVILLRQDPPFDMAYITTTHLLEMVHPQTLVVNNPASVRNAPEKILVNRFPQLMPPTLISRNFEDIRSFRDEFRDIVIKPIYGNGGNAVFHLPEGDENLGSLTGLFGDIFREPFMIQQYLPAVKDGDKRIILIDGEFAGAINRIPADNDMRSNMVQGGRAQATELTDREREICQTIGTTLKKMELTFVGIDVIGGLLTEINVTSPTGLRAIEKLSGVNLAAQIWDVIEERQKN